MPLDDSQSLHVGVTSDGRQELKLAGEINVFLAPELHHTAVQVVQQGGDTVVNCHQAQSLDFAALQILVALGDALKAQGHSCQIMGLSADLTEAISRVGLGPHLGLSKGGLDQSPPASALDSRNEVLTVNS
jgi:anti-anti-sigma regulatory factor